MAIYAPTSQDGNSSKHKQVASLVKANTQNTANTLLTSITIDDDSYKLNLVGIESMIGQDGTVPYLGRDSAPKTGYVPETIFRQDVFICENEEDYE
jgi:hypothetical protein